MKKPFPSEDELLDFNSLYSEIIEIIIRRSHPDNPNGRDDWDWKIPDESIKKLGSIIDRLDIEDYPMGEYITKSTAMLFNVVKLLKNPNHSTWKNKPHPFNKT
jgi:hypothetical protein